MSTHNTVGLPEISFVLSSDNLQSLVRSQLNLNNCFIDISEIPVIRGRNSQYEVVDVQFKDNPFHEMLELFVHLERSSGGNFDIILDYKKNSDPNIESRGRKTLLKNCEIKRILNQSMTADLFVHIAFSAVTHDFY